ncbi:hypothetical protein TTHERM_00723100 (macronuclear) [Tetrahymena thermophila SB210]|uniref:SET domain-containing protein n=1 Tax=Tetrahymena thermophila (strain SB210) TaxID=312017 RepID=I7LZK9_TETTS|nr:hypothetical protein TTHERM_00723100 [Tetrahymena thermophila SB210]EAR84125.1 hypothetical protein TTHERM_00723100 [Tetrahymena thermophila SB210]|eukprot:XP_001031788.1 hypothetical protein TTHERM_00723100 [Tetrahymena thermophila SB210]
MDASQMMIHFGQKPLGNEFYCQLKENHVPEQYAQYLMEIKTQKPQDFYIILKAFKTGGRLKPLEQLLIHNNSYFKPEEAYESKKQNKFLNRNRSQENVEVYNDEYYKMIIENPYFENCNLIEEKKVADILTQGFIPQQDNFIWALVVEKSQLLKKEVNFLAQNQFKEQLQINVYGQDISDQKKEFISGWTEQDINKRISALLNVEPGDIIGLINPEKSLDRQAYATLAVKCNQIFFIKSGIDLDQFLDKQILNKPMNQLQQEKRKIFVQKYLKTRKAIWSEKNIVDLIQILTKACYYDEVDKFCNIFNNINMVLSNLSNQTKQEINKSLFLCNMKRGLHQEALSYYQKAQNEGLIMDQYKEEIIQILFNFRKFDEVQKEWQTLDNRQQNKLKHIIAQTNLILDFKNEGKNFDKIVELMKQKKNFHQLIQNYYGPIEIRKATIQLGRDDRVQDIGRGIFLTKKVNKRQLLWAERDLTYKPNQRNNVKTMFETLKDMLSNNLLRARLRHLYQDGMTNFTFPEVSLYSNDNYDLQKQGCVPQITDEDLWNIVNSSSHTIYPKLYQSEQTKEEEGLWPIFSFVNHSISNRNIEVIVQQGFLFVFSTMSLPENTQIFYNYVLNIDNEDVIKSVKSKYGLQEL